MNVFSRDLNTDKSIKHVFVFFSPKSVFLRTMQCTSTQGCRCGARRLLFYVDQGDQSSDSHFHVPGIATAHMDGSEHRFIHRGADLLSPQRLTLDRVNRRLYFTDPQLNCIFQLDYDGHSRCVTCKSKSNRSS